MGASYGKICRLPQHVRLHDVVVYTAIQRKSLFAGSEQQCLCGKASQKICGLLHMFIVVMFGGALLAARLARTRHGRARIFPKHAHIGLLPWFVRL
eukprot:6226338-Amphidinium_carterae.1